MAPTQRCCLLSQVLSFVDTVADWRGQVACTLALAQLTDERGEGVLRRVAQFVLEFLGMLRAQPRWQLSWEVAMQQIDVIRECFGQHIPRGRWPACGLLGRKWRFGRDIKPFISDDTGQ